MTTAAADAQPTDRDDLWRTLQWVATFTTGPIHGVATAVCCGKTLEEARVMFCNHDWWRNPDGSIDTETFSEDPHYGPMCKKCGDCFCMTCEPDRWREVNPLTPPET